MGPWRYSMALVIVLAALIDVMWWVPAAQRAQARDAEAREARAAIQATIPRCRAAQIRAEMDRLEAEHAALRAELDALMLVSPHADPRAEK